MSLLFVDTSALAKRYLVEAGSRWIGSVTHPTAGNVIVIADLTTVEIASLLARRVSEPVTFVTSDQNLLAAANAEDLATDDPLAHP